MDRGLLAAIASGSIVVGTYLVVVVGRINASILVAWSCLLLAFSGVIASRWLIILKAELVSLCSCCRWSG